MKSTQVYISTNVSRSSHCITIDSTTDWPIFIKHEDPLGQSRGLEYHREKIKSYLERKLSSLPDQIYLSTDDLCSIPCSVIDRVIKGKMPANIPFKNPNPYQIPGIKLKGN